MKWLSILFSIYILFLSARPCCDKDCCKDDAAQTSRSSHQPEAPCSPFFMCNSCHGFVIPESGIEIKEAETKILSIIPLVLNLTLSGFNSPAWQPPRYC